MPRSVASYYSIASGNLADDPDEQDEHEEAAIRNAYHNKSKKSRTAPVSPVHPRRHASSRASDADLRTRSSARVTGEEYSHLLNSQNDLRGGYNTVGNSIPSTPHYSMSRQQSYLHTARLRNPSRRASFSINLAKALAPDGEPLSSGNLESSKPSLYDDRLWYDQFSSTDWVHDSIADAFRLKELRSRKDFRGRLNVLFDAAQGWIVVAIIGVVTAGFAYTIDVTETVIFDYKTGHCTTGWWKSKRRCCDGASICERWNRWSRLFYSSDGIWTDFLFFCVWVIALASVACMITLQTKTIVSSTVSLSTLDENLGAEDSRRSASKINNEGRKPSVSPHRRFREAAQRPPTVYYPAAGSGVAEIKVILSGFVLHGYLGVKTLACKSVGLVLSVASGLSLGKEGPYVHIAACVGNVVCRLFVKYRKNDGKRREVLSAAAAAGVAVAFGAPIGGVLFSLEEVSYYFPPKTLFRTFFCCIAAALSLKAMNPYGTGKIVLFEVRYLTDWRPFELVIFSLVGVLGGALGALFIKASRLWAKTFRQVKVIKKYPLVEILIVASITALVSFWNRYTRLPVAELLYELSAPCSAFVRNGTGLCPTQEHIPDLIRYLLVAFVVKSALTVITFGTKVPAGIYVPSMVVGGLMGRIVGHSVQYLTLTYPDHFLFSSCSADGNPESCVVPGVYALVAAGATMTGVTRLSVTLAVILFELTGSLNHVLPFSLGVLIAKWTADAIEPLSIYDLLIDMAAYPYLDAKVRPAFTTDLGELTRKANVNRIIDISASPLVQATALRAKLEYLHMAGELDGGLPILKYGVLVGLIPGPDLEFALDRLESEEGVLCLMRPQAGPQDITGSARANVDADGVLVQDAFLDEEVQPVQARLSDDPTDFTPFIDPAPVSLDICSPMDLVFECFVKLGLRYICVLREGKFVGLVHKKAFVHYVKEVHEHEE